MTHSNELDSTFTWSSKDDILTLDPHAQNHQTTLALLTEVYEALVKWDENFDIEPALAVRWESLSPLRWRFHLREGVKFHQGQTFTADDVVFSFRRLAGHGSDLHSYVRGIVAVERQDELTVDIVTDRPNPVLLRQLVDARVMCRLWTVSAGCELAQDYTRVSSTPVSIRANGTGALRVLAWQPGQLLEFEANDNWWGQRRHGYPRHVRYVPIADPSARAHAVIRGEVQLAMDLTNNEATQCVCDGDLKMLGGAENRTIFVGFNLRPQRLGTLEINPFADPRVSALFSSIFRLALIVFTMQHPLSECLEP
ncbi:ABC transporter substrate-binding protein [Burkholderia sp. Ac-20365]|jgi:peptide/nickel transport system substrate-binding protein|uniref:ABC transporter substrate-binding protein n=1 Tax=Burkholderia sp. Ac-20365 TaxID=2703897 RepID=UPI00197C3F9C|nr:ABC transporter substrate-binding protein [Burkholderia sp. Ac-20365]MBN3760237.1 hypothetical protein [Burkholderia sp. Ac-20365]